MSDDWAAVVAVADLMGIEHLGILYVMERAEHIGASAEVVLEGYRRTIEFWCTNEDSAFEDFEALPPGDLDLRVLDQDAVWVDVLRVPHRIDDGGDVNGDYLVAIIEWLQQRASELAEAWAHMHETRSSDDPAVWLENTILMRGLRAEAGKRGVTDLMPPAGENSVGSK